MTEHSQKLIDLGLVETCNVCAGKGAIRVETTQILIACPACKTSGITLTQAGQLLRAMVTG